ncbi:MAG: hypothetical protein ACLQM6_13840 [Acidobacteriaceae bacterium]
MPADTYIAKTIENAPDAIASHVRWKIALLLAARMHEPLSERATRSIEHPEECSIRKWLLSEHTLHLRGRPEYMAALDQHTAFHGQMQGIAHLINGGEYDQAERLLNAADPFQNASTALANAIMALDRAVDGKPVSQVFNSVAVRKTA